jgi:chromosome segregation ATPase
MNARRNVSLVITIVCLGASGAVSEPSSPFSGGIFEGANAKSASDSIRETESRADKRYAEMLGKMQQAVEEIAQLYGNPIFLQVFTNDADRASALKERLGIARHMEDVRHELEELEKKQEELVNDIALKQREAASLSGKLVRQRKALDALAAAFDQARDAVEDTTK